MAEIFNIDFEAGNFSELDDSVGGAELFVSSTGAITGTYSCNHEWTSSAQAVANSTSIAGATVFRVGLRIKIGGTFSFGTTQTAATFFDFLNGTAEYQLAIKKSGSNVIASFISTTSADIDDSSNLDDGAAHTIEIRVVKESAPAAGDGVNALYIDGVLAGEDTAVANTAEVEAVLVGFNNWQWTRLRSTSGSGHTGGIITDDWILRNDDTQIYPAGVATDEFDAGGLTAKPMDIDAAGSQLYIAMLDSLGEVGLIKFSTALDSDGTRIFEPGAGTSIGVQCGRFDADTIWIAGAFDGTNTVEKSEDAGTTFDVKDPTTFGAVSAFVIGPDSDDRVLIVDDGVDIQETINSGGEWIAKNTGLTPVTKSLARLDINVEEVAFGNESGANDNVDYSVNTGADLEDLNLPVTADVSSVIVN